MHRKFLQFALRGFHEGITYIISHWIGYAGNRTCYNHMISISYINYHIQTTDTETALSYS